MSVWCDAGDSKLFTQYNGIIICGHAVFGYAVMYRDMHRRLQTYRVQSGTRCVFGCVPVIKGEQINREVALFGLT